MRTTAAILIALTLTVTAAAQAGEYVREMEPFVVTTGEDTLDVPFWGGINSPKVSLIDLDGDSLTDLLVGDPGGRLGHFRNTGTVDNLEWTPITDRLGNIDIGTWHRLVDIDGDGDIDLFCDSRTGLTAFYENIAGPGGATFELADSAFGGFATGTNNTPDFEDLDADGDLDFFFGNLNGALEFYRRVGPPDSLSFEFVTDYYDSILAFPGGGAAMATQDPAHGFSVIKFVDIDADADLDLFWGDIFNPQLYFFANEGDSVLSDLTWVTEDYLPTAITGFNHPAFADFDNDIDLDMVLAVSAERDNLHMYRNTGTVNEPAFTVEDSNLITMIEVGSNSGAAMGDLDGDGDLDLLLGGSSTGLTYFENTGTKYAAALELITDSYKNISAGSNMFPALCDWDGDNDLDLLIGTGTGYIQYWRNEGTATDFQPVLADAELGGIKIDQLAVPRPADLNGDGLLDLVVGEWDFNGFANVLLYENVGDSGSPSLSLVTTRLLPRVARLSTVPQVYDWDEDGRLDLIVPDPANVLRWYRNTAPANQFPDSLTIILQSDTLPGSMIGSRLAVEFKDIDGDGDDDVFVGEEDGGLSFFRHSGSCCESPRGNVDDDPESTIDIGDLTYLIGYLYLSADLPNCLLEANIDGDSDEIIDIGDLTWLIAYLYLEGPDLPDCP